MSSISSRKRSHSVSERDFTKGPDAEIILKSRKRTRSVESTERRRDFIITKSYQSNMPKFGMTQVVTECVLKNDTEHPEKYLKNVIGTLIDDAHRKNPDAALFQMLIEADGLEMPILIPPRERKQNTPEAILNKIDRVSVSKRAANLMHAVLRILITLFMPPPNTESRYGYGSARFNPRRYSFLTESEHFLSFFNTNKK